MLKIQITTDKNVHEVMVFPSIMKSQAEVEELIDYLTVLKDKLWPHQHSQKSALQQFKDEIAQAEASARKVRAYHDNPSDNCSSCGLQKEHCICH